MKMTARHLDAPAAHLLSLSSPSSIFRDDVEQGQEAATGPGPRRDAAPASCKSHQDRRALGENGWARCVNGKLSGGEEPREGCLVEESAVFGIDVLITQLWRVFFFLSVR